VSITTYTELQAAIAEWLARPGDGIVTTVAPDLIRLAEARINFGSGEIGHELYSPPLRVRQMETRATALLTGEYVALPSDFVELRELKINTVPERNLTYVTPQQFADAAASSGAGVPVVYTLIGNDIRFGPAPAAAEGLTAELLYYAAVPALSASAPSNWLLQAAPNVYLFGALLEASPYIGDDSQLPRWFAMFSAAIGGLQAQDRRARHGNAPLLMSPITPTP
jgi:hypothetical protein